MNLPGLAGKVRWLSLVMLGILAALVTQRTGHALSGIPEIITSAFALTAILLCFWIIKKGVSPIGLLYGMMALFTLVSL
jgi:mannose/fructose/N-acetylgalactosamine-specific phosphotransferase system component IID